MFKSLSDYVAALEQAGELIRVRRRVDPALEIAEITDRFSKAPGGGKALLFENTGTEFPVLTNLMGSHRRICMALGVGELEEIPARIEELFEEFSAPRQGWFEKLRMLPVLGELSGWLPRTRSGRGACQEVVWQGAEASLDRLPILTCWPHDGGAFVTLPLVHTLDPDTGIRNVGMYRMQRFDPHTTGMHWHRHKTGERHYRRHKELGRRMPVSVCLGGDPVYTYAATAPMPDGIDEYLLAGFLRGRAVELVKCRTNDLYVPADCDFVIEGWVDPAEEKVIEGDFGDHTGFYSLKDYYPQFHVSCITHRRGAIYPATLVGIPPQEDAWIARATERVFLAPMRISMMPELLDLWMPQEGVAHNLAVASIDKSYPGQAFKVASAMWGAGQMMFNKAMVVASGPLTPGALQQALDHFDPHTDLLFSRGTLDVLDHSTPTPGVGGKVAVDLTDRLPEEGAAPAAVPFAAPADSSHTRGFAQWRTVFTTLDPEEVIPSLHGVKFLVRIDPAIDLSALRPESLLWLALANIDPARDGQVSDLVDGSGCLTLDARRKTTHRWPNVVTMSPEVIEQVDRRWAELGLGEPLASPSLEYLPLVLPGGAEVSR